MKMKPETNKFYSLQTSFLRFNLISRWIIISIAAVFFGILLLYSFTSSLSSPPEVPYYSEDVTNPRIIKENGIFFIEHGYLGNNKREKKYIGTSSIDLDQFINRYNVVITASYPKHFGELSRYERKQQCIAQRCVNFFEDESGAALVVDISDIRFSTE